MDSPGGNGDWKWKSVDGKTSFDLGFEPPANKYELCMTGNAFKYLHSTKQWRNYLHKLLPHIRVFARMSPKQKEHAINELKYLGYTTLMCGDGYWKTFLPLQYNIYFRTNDVGALKHVLH